MTLESKYQKKLINRYKNEGWLVLRLITVTSTIALTGIPDLVAMKPSGDGLFRVKFIEVKAKGGKAAPLQKYVLSELKKLGFEVELDEEIS